MTFMIGLSCNLIKLVYSLLAQFTSYLNFSMEMVEVVFIKITFANQQDAAEGPFFASIHHG